MIRTRWTRVDRPGAEDFEMEMHSSGWILHGRLQLEGVAIEYRVEVDRDWNTREVSVQTPEQNILESVRAGEWSLEHLQGCIDVDLAFTPSTNTLPIRRLKLQVGESAPVRAAWLRYPELRWEILNQEYRRVGENKYAYRSPNFAADLTVDREGLIRDYPGLWKRG